MKILYIGADIEATHPSPTHTKIKAFMCIIFFYLKINIDIVLIYQLTHQM